MIFEELCALAERENLGFFRVFKNRKFANIHIDDDGKILSVEHVQEDVCRADLPNARPETFRISCFTEPLMYAFGENKNKKRAKAAIQHAAEAYADIARKTKFAGAKAVAAYYELLLKGKHKIQPDWLKKAPFYVFVHRKKQLQTHPKLRRAIEEVVGGTAEVEDRARPCSVTGELVQCQITPHANTKGLSSSMSGSSLISFNASSQDRDFGKGPERFLNAPMSSEVSRKWSAALNWLAENRKVDLNFSFKKSKDLNTVVWSETGHEIEKIVPVLLSSVSSSLEDRAVAVARLQELDDTDTSNMYFLTLTGNQGRLALREWWVRPVGDVIRNLRAFVNDFACVFSEEKQTSGLSLVRLAGCWIQRDERGRLIVGPSRRDIIAMFRCAIDGLLVPSNLSPRNPHPKATDGIAQQALQRAYGVRNMGMDSSSFSHEVVTEGQSDAYRVGRACLLFEKTQQQATGARKSATTRSQIDGRIAKRLVRRPEKAYAHIHERFLAHTSGARAYERFVNEVEYIMLGVVLPERFTSKEKTEFHQGFGYERARQNFLIELAKDKKSAAASVKSDKQDDPAASETSERGDGFLEDT